MSVETPLPESERLRMLAIMGVDVYVPRIAPLACAVDNSPAHTPATAHFSQPPLPAAVRVLIRGVDAGDDSPLLAAVLRGARLRRSDWALASGSAGPLPEWQFGQVEMHAATLPALTLPSLTELRDSVLVRRDTWRLLRTWLRRT